ncbi:MAG: 50S ribosomal protein L28 [Elusimicrobiota bacterium]|nr:50S ribosomal protein L28 [Elusimicrobiota bacterium]
MSKICSVCGKKAMAGNNRSKSNRATRRTWGVNLQKIRFEYNNKTQSGYVCVSCFKNVKKI